MKSCRTCLVLFLALAFAFTGFPESALKGDWQFVGVPTADAQSKARKKRRSLLSVLFGGRKAKKKSVTSSRKRRKRRTSNRKRIGSGTLLANQKKTVEKNENAKIVLVLGDFFAGGLADGLTRSFSDLPDVVVVDKSLGLSGFVRNDIIDWPTSVPAVVEATKPSHIVVMLGSNDRQLIREGGKNYKKRTEEWDKIYQSRVTALAASLKNTGVNFTWMGLPPVRFSRMNKDFLVFNEMYRKAAEDAGGTFVDVWDGFSNSEGLYSRSGPDINGQIVMLRPKDGINLTKAGKRRLAFYVEGALRKSLSGSAPGVASNRGFELENVLPETPRYDPAKTGKTVVVRLNDPLVDGASELAGGDLTSQPSENAIAGAAKRLKLPPSTSTPKSTAGRVDSYAWPNTGTNNPAPAIPALAVRSR